MKIMEMMKIMRMILGTVVFRSYCLYSAVYCVHSNHFAQLL